jgi:hypothetical protein
MKKKNSLSKKAPSLQTLKRENKNLREAMSVIRFLAFKHEVQYWEDAGGTDKEKMGSILTLAREANWSDGGMNRSKAIKAKHTL